MNVETNFSAYEEKWAETSCGALCTQQQTVNNVQANANTANIYNAISHNLEETNL